MALAPFLVSRALCATATYMGAASLSQPVGAGVRVTSQLLSPWTAYDGSQFIALAQHGYSPDTASFFPLYPAILRLAGTNATVLAAWGIVVSHLAFFAALVIVAKITARDFGVVTARRTLWVLALLPTSFIFSALYSDSLFLMLLALTWYLWTSGHFWQCCVVGLLTGLTRNSGLVVTAALAISLWQRDDRRFAVSLPAVLSPTVGLVAFQLYLAIRFANPLVGINAHHVYGRALAAPWQPLVGDIQALLALNPLSVAALVSLAPIAIAIWLVWQHRNRVPLAYPVLLLGVIAMELIYPRDYVPHLNGTLRFLAAMFPFAQMIALSMKSHPERGGGKRLLILGALEAALCFVFSYAWGQNSFISG